MSHGVWIQDPKTGELLDAGEYYRRTAARTAGVRTGNPTLLLDLAPDQAFVSPVDGSYITSRRELVEHNARNDVVDVGNDPAYRNPKPPKLKKVSAIPLMQAINRGEVPVRPADRPESHDLPAPEVEIGV